MCIARELLRTSAAELAGTPAIEVVRTYGSDVGVAGVEAKCLTSDDDGAAECSDCGGERAPGGMLASECSDSEFSDAASACLESDSGDAASDESFIGGASGLVGMLDNACSECDDGALKARMIQHPDNAAGEASSRDSERVHGGMLTIASERADSGVGDAASAGCERVSGNVASESVSDGERGLVGMLAQACFERDGCDAAGAGFSSGGEHAPGGMLASEASFESGGEASDEEEAAKRGSLEPRYLGVTRQRSRLRSCAAATAHRVSARRRTPPWCRSAALVTRLATAAATSRAMCPSHAPHCRRSPSWPSPWCSSSRRARPPTCAARATPRWPCSRRRPRVWTARTRDSASSGSGPLQKPPHAAPRVRRRRCARRRRCRQAPPRAHASCRVRATVPPFRWLDE